MSDDVKRAYRSEVRTAAAKERRVRVLDAAAELFVSRGYPGTSLKAVAERAGVGERTVYDQFGDKFELYKQTVRYRTRGDDDPIPHPERPGPIAVQQAVDADAIVELHMGYGADLMERAGDLLMSGLSAAGAVQLLGENLDRSAKSVRDIHLRTTRRLAELGHLMPGLDPVIAADVLFALSGPANYHYLRRNCRWSFARYRTWLIETSKQQVLDPQRPAPTST